MGNFIDIKKKRNLLNKFISLLSFISCYLSLEGQQQIEVSGCITNIKGDPIELANISVKKTSYGTISDRNGNYKLVIPVSPEIILVYSCVSYIADTLVIDEIPVDLHFKFILIPFYIILVNDRTKKYIVTHQIFPLHS